MATEWKAKGNTALSAGNFDEAIECYSKAIEINPNDHVFFSNRSAAYLSKHDGEHALADAEECVRLNGEWAKGYGRKGAALHEMNRFDDAIASYEQGLKVDPNNAQLKRGLDEVQRAAAEAASPMGVSQGGGGMGGLGAIFGPDMFAKIAANPSLAKYLADEAFVAKLKQIQQNPNTMNMHLSDPRIMEVLSALLGINMNMAGGDPGAGAGPSEEEMEEAARQRRRKREAEEEAKEAERKAAEAEAAMTDEDRALRAAKLEAQEIKARGNAHYKNKEFTEALACYDEALAKDPTNMAFMINKAAVYLEQGDSERCITECREAIDLGRTHRADYELVAKAYVRIATAHTRAGQMDDAITAYRNAQVEAYSRDVERKLKAAEKKKRELDALNYQDPEKAAEAKERGNVLFKSGDFPGAVKEYEEAIRRDPHSPVYYANRAAALTKLADFNGAMADCEKALLIDPAYVKAYSRRGAIQFFMKEYHKAMTSYKKGLELDPESAECRQGLDRTVAKIQELSRSGEVDQERAAHGMADPEIQMILRDPVMQQVLNDFQNDPNAAQKHMRDAGVMAKIEKLIAAGVLATK